MLQEDTACWPADWVVSAARRWRRNIAVRQASRGEGGSCQQHRPPHSHEDWLLSTMNYAVAARRRHEQGRRPRWGRTWQRLIGTGARYGRQHIVLVQQQLSPALHQSLPVGQAPRALRSKARAPATVPGSAADGCKGDDAQVRSQRCRHRAWLSGALRQGCRRACRLRIGPPSWWLCAAAGGC